MTFTYNLLMLKLMFLMGLITININYQKYTSDEVLMKLMENEKKIINVEAHFQCLIPERNNHIFYEVNWGYDRGKEYLEGIWQKKSKQPSGLSQPIKYDIWKQKYAFDGEKYSYRRQRPSDEGKREGSGRITTLKNEELKGYDTPYTLLGYNIKVEGRQTLGEAIRQAQSIDLREKMENIGGNLCYVVEVTGIQKNSYKDVLIWIDPQRDFRPLKIEVYRRNEIIKWDKADLLARIENIILAKIEDTWFPVEGDVTFYYKQLTKPENMTQVEFAGLPSAEQLKLGKYVLEPLTPTYRTVVEIASVRINKGINLEKFRVEFPLNYQVYDDFEQKGYWVGGKRGYGGIFEKYDAIHKDR